MTPQPPSFVDVSAKLESFYGTPQLFPLKELFELIVWENVAYLVDDQRREAVYQKLRQEVEIDPVSIARCPQALLAQIIHQGGMQPDRRAEKLHTSARIILEIGPDNLQALLAADPKKARKVLQRF